VRGEREERDAEDAVGFGRRIYYLNILRREEETYFMDCSVLGQNPS